MLTWMKGLLGTLADYRMLQWLEELGAVKMTPERIREFARREDVC